ncbi:Sphingosine kinase 1 [Orchesella cincta]|uniref:Sphingosine kinase 1 n=1 Tax=Orchesella cincta TaxID=48709 RepID=A0A1D2N4Q8_ORCCI|nr:Sphingosine kinase 1 [Orchesella cincta]
MSKSSDPDPKVDKVPTPIVDESEVEKLAEEDILREGIFTVHYPVCKPLLCEVSLTPTELIFEEYDESGYESDCDALQERFPLEDIYGLHVVERQNEEPSLPSVYLCIIFYTSALESDDNRKRASRILEISQSKELYLGNLEVAKDWSLDLEHLLKLKYPNLHNTPTVKSLPNRQSIEDIFNSLKTNGRVSDAGNGNTTQEASKIDLDFCSGTFSLVQSILFRRQLLVIVNPVSGQGKGENLYKDQISPVFEDCGISVNVITTEYSGHAAKFISAADLKKFDGIVAVGGDGLVNEVVNGLRTRSDSQQALHLPLGVVATGSGNGLARSIASYYGESQGYRNNPVLYSALAVARGCVSPVNLAEVSLDGRTSFSFLSVGWGLLSDIDIESEVLRAVGEVRFVIWSFVRLAKFRRYNAELSYIPNDASGSINSRVIINDEFVSVYSTCQSHIGSDMLFAKDAKPFDNTLHLTILPSSTGRFAAANFLFKLLRGYGQHTEVDPVKYVKVKEFTIRCKDKIQGTLTVDGEQVTGEEITVKLCDTPLYMYCME